MAYQHQTCLKDQNQGHDLPTAMYLVFRRQRSHIHHSIGAKKLNSPVSLRKSLDTITNFI